MTASPRPAVLVAFGVTVVLIGLNFVAVRISNLGLAPLWGATLRFFVAFLLLAGYMAVRGIPVPKGRAFVGAALYGTLLFAVFFGLMYWGLVEVSAAVGSIAGSTVPLTTFLTAVLVRQERFRWDALLGAAVVVVGFIVLVGTDVAGGASPARYVAVVLATIAAAVSGVVVKGFPKSHPVATNAVGMGVAAALLGVASFASGDTWMLPARGDVWLAVIYLVFSSLALFPLMVWVITEWTASASSFAVVLAPIVTIPASLLLGQGGIGWQFAGAVVIILIGVYWGALRGALRGRRRKAAVDEAP